MKTRWISLLIGLTVLGATAVSGEEHEREERRERPNVGEREVLAFVGKHSPPFHEALEELREERPEKFEETVKDISRFILEFREIREENPDEAEVMMKLEIKEIESELIARQFRETDNGKEKDLLRERLARLLNHLFELKQHADERELHHLEKEMMELRQRLHQRNENRDRIIRRRMQELLDEGEEDWMDW